MKLHVPQSAIGPPTTSQHLIWTGQQLHVDIPLYNMALMFNIEGPIEPRVFQQAFQRIVDESDSMRTVFEVVDGNLQRRILAQQNANCEFLDVRDCPEPEQWVADWSLARCQANFDLSQASFDSVLLRLDSHRFAWFYNQHHINTDATSFGVIFDRLQKHYTAIAGSCPTETHDSLPQYEDYISFEATHKRNSQASRDWFEQKAHTVPPAIYGRTNNKNTTASSRSTLKLTPEQSQRLKTLAMDSDVRALTRHASQFNLMATLLFALLYRVTGQTSLAIGAPAHNRMTRDFKQSIGLFIEVFPLSVAIEPGETFASLLKKFRAESMSFMRHAGPGAVDAKDQRCFNTILNYITAKFGRFCGLPTSSQWLHSGHCDSGHAIRVQIHDFDDTGDFVLHFDLNKDVFSPPRRAEILRHCTRLLDAMLEDMSHPIDAVNLLNETETSRLCESLPQASALAKQTVISQFSDQVRLFPDRIALACGSEKWTYLDLNREVNALAIRLRESGAMPGERIAICLPRSFSVIASILAVLKLRAHYIPIDTRFPKKRIDALLQDCENPLVLTNSDYQTALPSTARCLLVDAPRRDTQSTATKPSAELRFDPITPEDIAYMIYTSGSTGRPKGVVINHSNLSHYLTWASEKYVANRSLSFPLFSPLTFDLTVTSIFLPLVTGGQIVIYPESDGPADLALLEVVQDDLVDIIKLTPSHLQLLRNIDLKSSRVKQLILGGEDLRCSVAQDAWNTFGGLEIHNEYGPTEATVGCIVHTYDPRQDRSGSVPIGKPIDRMKAYILNEAFQHVPSGVPGELFLVGEGVSNGYWHRPNLTAERFMNDPFCPSQKMYRTGDLARIRDDGVFEYLGRTDQQVKIRGVRIELGEIEAAVQSHPQIESCVVTLSSLEIRREHSVSYCVRCGLASNYPDSQFDSDGMCNLCASYDVYKTRAEAYFRSMDDLRALFSDAKRGRGKDSPYDCISLLSGGKDSTYMLGRLVDMGLHVLAFTLDNGYLSDEAKANIQRVVDTLGVDHIFGSTPMMNQIFVDSLNRHANVCQGCFKTVYTLSMQIARDKNIPFIATGLSRGQFFETRLTEELFTDPSIDANKIDATILRARKEYHRVDDAVSRLLDVEMFRDDSLFEQVQFVDFYRYCDVELDEMLTYLDQRLPWVRPTDTGRSTNCLINDVGIHIHKQQRGFHNYALPYSWDVRVGHKQRDAALAELDDEIDEQQVKRMLAEIGYQDVDLAEQNQRLVAYFVSSADVSTSDLMKHIAAELPDFMVPSHFLQIDKIPLSDNGKIDRAALPTVAGDRPQLPQRFAPPKNTAEAALVQIWKDVLRIEQVGIDDNFFDLGGDSITAIQIVARANKANLQLTPSDLFDTLTVAKLAAVTGNADILAEQGDIQGHVTLTPIQRWYFDTLSDSEANTSQVLHLKASFPINRDILDETLGQLMRHHDALRIAYRRSQQSWKAHNMGSSKLSFELMVATDDGLSTGTTDSQFVTHLVSTLHETLSPIDGKHLAVAWLPRNNELIFVVHHLAMDAASWPILLEDLATTYEQIRDGVSVSLPLKSTSFQQWSDALAKHANTQQIKDTRSYWQSRWDHQPTIIPCDQDDRNSYSQRDTHNHTTSLDQETTKQLIELLPTMGKKVQEVLLAAVGTTLAEACNVDTVQFDVEGHGRETIDKSVDITRTVGWFTSIYPVQLTIDHQTPTKTFASVKRQLGDIPNNGLSNGLLQYRGDPAPSSARQSAANILFNYLGHSASLIPSCGEFALVSPLALHRSPNSPKLHDIEINAMIVGETLQVDWSYNRQLYDPQTIKFVAGSLCDHIGQITKELLSTGDQKPSAEFPDANLDDENRNKLSRLLNRIDNKRGK